MLGTVLTYNGTAYSCTSNVQISCPPGSVVQSVAADGTPNCSLLPSACVAGQVLTYDGRVYTCTSDVRMSCPVGTVMQVSGSTPSCVPTTMGGNCPAGQVATGVNSNGTPVCGAQTVTCAAGTLLQAISATGVPTCSPAVLTLTCPSGQVMVGTNNDGSLNCAATPASTPPVTGAAALYMSSYTYIDSTTYNNDLYNGLYVVGMGGIVADNIWASCRITDPSDETQVSTDALTIACMANVCAGHFSKYPVMAQANGFCAAGDVNPTCATHMQISDNCEYTQ